MILLCSLCARTVINPVNDPLRICGSCAGKISTHFSMDQHPLFGLPDIGAIHCLGKLDDEWTEVIHRCKYGNDIVATRSLGRCLAQKLSTLPASTMYLPIPAPLTRFLRRGFNIPDVLAREISTPRNNTILKDVHTNWRRASSAATSRYDRWNIAHDFRLGPEARFSVQQAQAAETSIVLVDDVCTTGHTLLRMILTLREAGYTRPIAVAHLFCAVPEDPEATEVYEISEIDDYSGSTDCRN